MATVAIVYHSGYGHTKKQAEAVNKGVANVAGCKAHLISVDEVANHWEALDAADAIIFGSPTYMGSISAKMKQFMEDSSKRWSKYAWKDKIAAGFTNSGSQNGDKLNSLLQFVVFAGQHAMIWVGLDLMPGNNTSKGSTNDLNRLGSFLGAMSQSNNDESPEKAPIESDLKTAERLGERVAKVALRFAKN
jgi:multimeric flavodoxin WrbA